MLAGNEGRIGYEGIWENAIKGQSGRRLQRRPQGPEPILYTSRLGVHGRRNAESRRADQRAKANQARRAVCAWPRRPAMPWGEERVVDEEDSVHAAWPCAVPCRAVCAVPCNEPCPWPHSHCIHTDYNVCATQTTTTVLRLHRQKWAWRQAELGRLAEPMAAFGGDVSRPQAEIDRCRPCRPCRAQGSDDVMALSHLAAAVTVTTTTTAAAARPQAGAPASPGPLELLPMRSNSRAIAIAIAIAMHYALAGSPAPMSIFTCVLPAYHSPTPSWPPLLRHLIR